MPELHSRSPHVPSLLAEVRRALRGLAAGWPSPRGPQSFTRCFMRGAGARRDSDPLTFWSVATGVLLLVFEKHVA